MATAQFFRFTVIGSQLTVIEIEFLCNIMHWWSGGILYLFIRTRSKIRGRCGFSRTEIVRRAPEGAPTEPDSL